MGVTVDVIEVLAAINAIDFEARWGGGNGRRRVPAIADRDRKRAGATAPAHGLALVRVIYPR